MSNPIELLQEIQKLMELKGENPFKIRAFEKAAHSLSGRDDLLERAKNGTLVDLPGIGKGIAEVLTEYLLQGHSRVRDELAQSLPPGLTELTQVPGLGPKKALILINELAIGSVAELEYACKENRLLSLKGFGPKVQQKILDGISFQKATQGYQKLSDAFEVAEDFVKFMSHSGLRIQIFETGALRRRCEVLQKLEFMILTDSKSGIQERVQMCLADFLKTRAQLLPFEFYFSTNDSFGYDLAQSTGSENHWKAIGSPRPFQCKTEEEFYSQLGLPWIPPETRETGEEVTLARNGQLGKILPWNGIRGVFHNHTNRSDGSATLQEMVSEAERLGYDYIGISDHSQSAFYAQGLKVNLLEEQEREIRALQEKHPKIRIFWGIESDILMDGALDYDSKVLKRFDFVIASIHSRFQMDRQAMTSRIINAIRNPYTRFLGHPTGRLLLGRKEYEVDMESVITEAAKCDVAVEINANPARLDLDWRWGPQMRKTGAVTSVNPDAHEVAGLQDTRFGIAMARKALLSVDQVVNSKSTVEIEKWLKRA